jgi:four helix bundle protein
MIAFRIGIGIAIGIAIVIAVSPSQGVAMTLEHERLDVYCLAIRYVGWVFEVAEGLSGLHRVTRDQWLRASQSIPLNIAEGNGRTLEADRRRFFEIARGSVLECAAIQDVLVVGKGLAEEVSRAHKVELDRMAAMLSRLGGRGYVLRDGADRVYGVEVGGSGSDSHDDPDPDSDDDPDSDSDSDSDSDGNRH